MSIQNDITFQFFVNKYFLQVRFRIRQIPRIPYFNSHRQTFELLRMCRNRPQHV
ncbi:hypothetical protein X975_24886, partial [Stegodyphus mimosarum]